MLSSVEALGYTAAMGGVILFCRFFPFLFYGGRNTSSPRTKAFLDFIGKTVPPAAMTVLAFNAIGSPFLENSRGGIMVLAASVFTAMVHLWKRNALISIVAGTALYMILLRILPEI